MTVLDEHGTRRRSDRKLVLVAAVFAVANLLALFLNIVWVLADYDRHETTDYVVSQDIWSPFIVAAWIQVVVNGVILVPWKRTRPAGLGVLLGAAAAILLFLGWLVFIVSPALA
ncbi:hypothetical protein [Nocardioides sp. URHA0020]|uniref:hypothetical protein n=1 Tax=Nocardioides sp. URHA0020 TaxID=1380392 RepID=UPI00048F516D|nr:hypothetical protein [Nocardioides sp. URHA0020]